MGRKLNHSRPTVINTELVPFDESFYVLADGQTEQWYYDNAALYSPNRKLVPLVLIPKLSVFDQDTKQTYSTDVVDVADPHHIGFHVVQWYVMEYNSTTGNYVETVVTSTTDSASSDYVLSGFNLIVKKNVSYSHGVTIRCVATYQDPRDSGITYTTQDTVLLTCNRDADVVYPEVAMTNPSARSFNPLLDYDGQGNQLSQFEFNAVLTNNTERADMGTGARYKADGWGTEEILPANDNGIVTCAPTMDIRYGDGSVEQDAEFMYRPTGNGEHLDVGSGYRTITWNQLIENGDFSDGTTGWYTNPSVTMSINTDGSCRITTNADTSGNFDIRRTLIIPSGHKVLVKVNLKSSFNTEVYAIIDGARGGTNFAVSQGVLTTYEDIVSAGDTLTYIRAIYVRFAAPVDSYIDIYNITFIDLTLMYGEGNEPSTVAAFEADYERWFGHPLVFEPYNAGETMRVYDGEGYKTDYGSITHMKGNSVAFSQIVQNGDFSDGGSGWVLSQSTSASATWSTNKVVVTSTAGTNTNMTVNRRINVLNGHTYYVSYYAKFSLAGRYLCGYFYSPTQWFGEYTYTANETNHVSLIVTANSNKTTIHLGPYSSAQFATGTTVELSNINCIDLTLMFGVGNEPATAAAFESWLDANIGLKPYYPYNTGELIPVTMTGIKTVGFNAWDGELEQGTLTNGQPAPFETRLRTKNFFKVIGGANYYLRVGTTSVSQNDYISPSYYDSNKNYISTATSNRNIIQTVPEGACYMKFMVFSNTSGITPTDNKDICINLAHDNSRNGEYEPYWEATREFDVTKVYGKINGAGSYVQVFPDGMKKVEGFDGATTFVNKDILDINAATADVNVRKVDLGSFTWRLASTTGHIYFVAETNSADFVPLGGQATDNQPVMCGKYTRDTWMHIYNDINPQTFGVYHVDKTFVIYDPNYSDAATFKSAMNGVYAYGVLATPIHYTDLVYRDNGQDIPLSSINRANFVWYGVENGAEVKMSSSLPYYVSGQGTSKLTVDAMWKENINVVLRATVDSASDALSPSKAYASVSWRIPDVDTHVVSQNGDAVRSDTTSMTFGTICNCGSTTLSDTVKNTHMRFDWKYRKSTSTTENAAGFGMTKTITAENLRNVKGSSSTLASTLVYPYVYVLGAWEQQTDNTPVSYDQPTTTKDNITYVRKID